MLIHLCSLSCSGIFICTEISALIVQTTWKIYKFINVDFSFAGIAIEAKSVREYSWKTQIRKLFERGALKGDSSNFTEILHADVFDINYRSVNRAYEQYVLSVGDFDERVMLFESQNEDAERALTDAPNTDDITKEEPPSVIHPNTLTPLTGRQYLKNRDSCANVSGMTPMMNAKECVIRLHTMLKSRRIPLNQSLSESGNLDGDTIAEIEREIKKKVAEMRDSVIQFDGNSTDFTRKRVDIAEKLFHKMLDDIAQEEVKMAKPEIGESLKQDLFLRSLFACAFEIVLFPQSSFEFPWILEALNLHAYHFYKIIELVVRTENQLSRDMVKHLNMLEEKILETMSWENGSPLWKTIDESNLPIPVCEEVCLPHQLSTDSGIGNYTLQTVKGNKIADSKSVLKGARDGAETKSTKPKRGGSLGLFFRKFYHLASVRMQDLCDKLNIADKEVRLKIWTCFEYVIVNNVNLMKNRHLDQILMCTVYVVCKVLEINLTFQEIMKCYRNQPQAVSSIYRDVLLRMPSQDNPDNINSPNGERGDLIKFYNLVYVKVIQNFALKFSSKSNNKGELLNLSPLPVSKSKGNSPFRRISDKHPIFIRCLDNTDNIPPSPVKPLSYYFNRSPAKDLQAINSMIQISSVKRNLITEDEDAPAIKRFAPRNGTTKLQDMIEDRKECKF